MTRRLRAAHRARLRTLSPGDLVTTGINSPWEYRVEQPRQETVIRVGRLTIGTDQATYTLTGREITRDNPLAFPRVIYRITYRLPEKDDQ